MIQIVNSGENMNVTQVVVQAVIQKIHAIVVHAGMIHYLSNI